MPKRQVIYEGVPAPGVDYVDGSAELLPPEDRPSEEDIAIGRWITEEIERDRQDKAKGAKSSRR